MYADNRRERILVQSRLHTLLHELGAAGVSDHDLLFTKEDTTEAGDGAMVVRVVVLVMCLVVGVPFLCYCCSLCLRASDEERGEERQRRAGVDALDSSGSFNNSMSLSGTARRWPFERARRARSNLARTSSIYHHQRSARLTATLCPRSW